MPLATGAPRLLRATLALALLCCASAARAQVSAMPASLVLGPTFPGRVSASQTVTLTNGGAVALDVTAVSPVGPFLADLGSAVLPVTLGPGETLPVSVTFAPSIPGPVDGELGVTLAGGATAPRVPLRGYADGLGLNPRPYALALGDVRVGATGSARVVLASNINQPLVLSALTLAPDAGWSRSAVPLPFVLPPQGTILLTVSFSPTARGLARSQLTVRSDAPNSPLQVELSANGVAPVVSVPAMLDAGTVHLGTPSDLAFDVSNVGDDVLLVSDAAVTGPDAGAFTVSTPLPWTIVPGGHLGVTVRHTPTSRGAQRATLTLTTDDPSTPSPAITLTSNALASFAVSAAVSGPGRVVSVPAGLSCADACVASFDEGTVVTLAAMPSAGALFLGWSGACTGAGACVLPPLAGPQSVTARFAAMPADAAASDALGPEGGAMDSSADVAPAPDAPLADASAETGASMDVTGGTDASAETGAGMDANSGADASADAGTRSDTSGGADASAGVEGGSAADVATDRGAGAGSAVGCSARCTVGRAAGSRDAGRLGPWALLALAAGLRRRSRGRPLTTASEA